MPVFTLHPVSLLLQCKAKASQLPQGISFGLVLVSPFTRCAQTAASLLPHVQLDLDAVVQFHRWVLLKDCSTDCGSYS